MHAICASLGGIGVRWLTTGPPNSELASPRTLVQRHRQMTPVYNRFSVTNQVLLLADKTYHIVFVNGTTSGFAQPPSRTSVTFQLVAVREREKNRSE